MTCMGFAIWWLYRAKWGALKQFEGTVHGAHGKPLQIAGKTQHLDIQWGEACGRASFIVIVGLVSPPCLIGMDIMRLLRVHIDVTNGTATPAQPDPQTVHLNAAQSQQRCQEKPLSQATGPSSAPQPQGGREEPLILPQCSHSERKCHCLEPGFQLLLPRRFLTQPPLHPANPHQVLHCRLPRRALLLLTPLAALDCSRRQTSPPRQPASSAATIRSLPRTSFSAPTTLSRAL